MAGPMRGGLILRMKGAYRVSGEMYMQIAHPNTSSEKDRSTVG
jgi:hypothetical protein